MLCHKCGVGLDEITGHKRDIENGRDLCEPCYDESELVDFNDTDVVYQPKKEFGGNLHPTFEEIFRFITKGA